MFSALSETYEEECFGEFVGWVYGNIGGRELIPKRWDSYGYGAIGTF